MYHSMVFEWLKWSFCEGYRCDDGEDWLLHQYRPHHHHHRHHHQQQHHSYCLHNHINHIKLFYYLLLYLLSLRHLQFSSFARFYRRNKTNTAHSDLDMSRVARLCRQWRCRFWMSLRAPLRMSRNDFLRTAQSRSLVPSGRHGYVGVAKPTFRFPRSDSSKPERRLVFSDICSNLIHVMYI